MSCGLRQYQITFSTLMLMSGCAGAGPAAQHGGNAAADSQLAGVWAEYWSPTGQAETQRYTFLQGGAFQWTAAASGAAPASGTALRKNGSYELTQVDAHKLLVLHVAETVLAGCDSACEGDGEDDSAFHIAHAPALLEQLDVSECPPNVEAQNLDAKYACLALGDRAFWRRDGSAPAQSSAQKTTPTAALAAPVVAEPPIEPPTAAAPTGSAEGSIAK